VCPVGGGYCPFFLFNNNGADNCDLDRDNDRDDNRDNDSDNDSDSDNDNDNSSILERAAIWWHLHLLR
jgi:hypothetical protein